MGAGGINEQMRDAGEAASLFNYIYETNLDFEQAGENRLTLYNLRKLYERGYTGSQIGGGRLSAAELDSLLSTGTRLSKAQVT
jgi:hypothetical protein